MVLLGLAVGCRAKKMAVEKTTRAIDRSEINVMFCTNIGESRSLPLATCNVKIWKFRHGRSRSFTNFVEFSSLKNAPIPPKYESHSQLANNSFLQIMVT